MRPFSDGHTVATFRKLIEKTVAEIDSLENEYVLKSSPTELEQFYINQVILHPLTLHTHQYCIENQTGTQIDVSGDFRRGMFRGERASVRGTRLDIAIPFEGDPKLWRIRPSTFSLSGYPEIEVRDDSIVFSVSFPDDAADTTSLKSDIDRNIQSLASAVQSLRNDVENHNRSAPETMRSSIQRKQRLAQSTTGAVAALGIPMRRRDAPLTYVAPVQRRPSPVKRPDVPQGAYRPEPSLDDAEYAYILRVIRSMSLVIERNPESFASLDEETIRTHFLIQLNGHYEGAATGETFNASGKTDILIRVEDRNIFIAECKFWHGQIAFNKAIDQILSYLSWRDSKCALVIFNKNRDSSAVRRTMHEVMESRQEHRSTVAYNPQEDSRYIFVKESDPGREIIITTLLFDIPN